MLAIVFYLITGCAAEPAEQDSEARREGGSRQQASFCSKMTTLPDTGLPMYLDEMCLIVKKKKTGGGGIAPKDACFHGISLLGFMARFAKVGSRQVLLHMSKRHTTLL